MFFTFNLDLSQVDKYVSKFMEDALGTKQKEELFIRHFFRMICSTSVETGNNFKEKLFWLVTTLKQYSREEVAKFLILLFGPLITVNGNLFTTLPYLSWWDFSETHFVEHGLEDLGVVLQVLYRFKKELQWKNECEPLI